MINFGIIGAGWRTEFFLRIADACPERFTVSGVVGRDPMKVARLGARFRVPVFESIDALVQSARPDFVVVSVPRGATIEILTKLAALDIPALCETPVGDSIEDMQAAWALVDKGARIQVAEQYWAQPHHAARLAFAHTGKLGTITQAQVSVAHGYHGISLIRRFLKIEFEPVKVSAVRFSSPIVEGPGRNGLPDQEAITASDQVFARFDFGDRLGIYDFTGDQYFSFIRSQRVLVRGERGEIVDEAAVYLVDYRTPIRSSLMRHSSGINGNLEGNYLKGIQAGEEWVYRNPLAPAPLSDEDIAIGTCMLRMETYIKEGVPFYSVAEACQDRYLDLLMEEALRRGETVASQPQQWQRSPE